MALATQQGPEPRDRLAQAGFDVRNARTSPVEHPHARKLTEGGGGCVAPPGASRRGTARLPGEEVARGAEDPLAHVVQRAGDERPGRPGVSPATELARE